MEPAQIVGRNVQIARTATDLTQRELGKRLAPYLGGEGWLPQTVSAAESGSRRFDAEELLALSTVLGRSPGWFLTPADPGEVVQFGDADPAYRLEAPWHELIPPAVIGEDPEQLRASLEALLVGFVQVRSSSVTTLNRIERLMAPAKALFTAIGGIGPEEHSVDMSDPETRRRLEEEQWHSS